MAKDKEKPKEKEEEIEEPKEEPEEAEEEPEEESTGSSYKPRKEFTKPEGAGKIFFYSAIAVFITLTILFIYLFTQGKLF